MKKAIRIRTIVNKPMTLVNCCEFLLFESVIICYNQCYIQCEICFLCKSFILFVTGTDLLRITDTEWKEYLDKTLVYEIQIELNKIQWIKRNKKEIAKRVE